VIPGLNNGTAYKFVAVANANGMTSASSQQSSPVTPREPAPVPPGKPLNLVMSNRSSATLEVTWNAPTTSGSSALVGYTVAWRETGKAWLTGNVKDVLGRTATLSGLTPGATYEIRVRARNAALFGAWSASTTGIVPVQAPAPKNVTGVANGMKITLTWSLVKVPSHSPVLKYSAYCAIGLEEPAHAQTGPTGTTTVVSVTQHKLYVCRVTAVNAAGRGIPSAPIRVTVK
jgi:titin